MESHTDINHIAKGLLIAGWSAAILFFLDLLLLVLWVGGNYLSIPESLLTIDIVALSIVSAILVTSATINFLIRLMAALFSAVKIRPASWFVWFFFMLFGISSLFIGLLISKVGNGIG